MRLQSQFRPGTPQKTFCVPLSSGSRTFLVGPINSTHITEHIGQCLNCCFMLVLFIFLCVPLLSLRRRQWQPTPVFLPGKSHGRRSLVGCSPWGHKGSDTTEQLHFHFSLSCIGEGNGNPLQCSWQENPRNRGAWWAAIYGVTQSQTRLKRLSSSSSNSCLLTEF